MEEREGQEDGKRGSTGGKSKERCGANKTMTAAVGVTGEEGEGQRKERL